MHTIQPTVLASGELASWSAVDTARAITAREISADEVFDAAIERAQEVDPLLRALATPVFEPRPRAAAGPLAGVPTAVKDLSELEGVRTTFGTLASGHHVSRRTSAPVRQLLATGLVPIGKSAAPEYGLTPTAETPGFPPTRNPWDLNRSVGGSSSGSAALVAAGVVPIAHASDGGGSIRIPAACTGLVGLKPTYGRLVPDEDMRGLPVKLVTHGVVTRTVADTAAWYAAAEQVHVSPLMPPLGSVTQPSSRRLRVALMTSSPVSDLDAEVVEATRRTGKELERLGHHVEEVDPPFGAGLSDDFVLYWGALAQGLVVAGFEKVGRQFKPWRFDAWSRGLAAHFRRNLHRFPATVARLRRFASEYAVLTRAWDVIACPTTGILPPPLGWLAVDLPFDEHLARATSFVPFTPPWNISGAPAISLPMAVSRSGLPIGVQLGAAFGDDRTLLQAAYELEAEGFNRPL